MPALSKVSALRPDPGIVGVKSTEEPLTVSEPAFWASVGAATVAHGFDLYWTKIGPASFTVEVGSAKGEELLQMAGTLLPATPGDKEGARRAKARILAKARRHGLRYNWEETPRLLAKCWDSSRMSKQ